MGNEVSVLRDKDIREPLFEYLEAFYPKIRILEEKRIGRSVADVVAVLEGALMGIEIKSDADTYVRLKRQVKDYDAHYDLNMVVVGSTHAMHAAEHVPGWWGILSAERTETGMDFYRVREPKPNPEMNWQKKLTLLWRPELAQLQEAFGMPKYREKSKAFVQEKILLWVENGKNSEEELSGIFSDLLFERDYETIGDTLKAYRTEKLQKKAPADAQESLEALMQVLKDGQKITPKTYRKAARRRKKAKI